MSGISHRISVFSIFPRPQGACEQCGKAQPCIKTVIFPKLKAKTTPDMSTMVHGIVPQVNPDSRESENNPETYHFQIYRISSPARLLPVHLTLKQHHAPNQSCRQRNNLYHQAYHKEPTESAGVPNSFARAFQQSREIWPGGLFIRMGSVI